MRFTRPFRIATCLMFGALALNGRATAADAPASYPASTVRIVVPYPPGGFNDTLGRVVANELSRTWGKPVIVDNKPGAGTILGTQAVARAPADGLTVLVAQFPFAANPWLYQKLPYDSMRDFTPVVLAGHSPMLLVVNAGSKVRSVNDLLSAARAAHGNLPYGSSGSGSSNHLAMAYFARMAKVEMNQVPYKGSTPMLTDLAGGQVEVAFDALPHALPFIQSGKLRPIAIADANRSSLMPDIPTVAESGVPGYDVSSWHGFMVRTGTPQAIVDKLNADINAILRRPEIQKQFATHGVAVDGGSPAQFQAFIGHQMVLWKRVVADAHIPAQ
ncbi:tripartite tricarboxylate transporter substrate binding protein [Cupriavidus sp. 2TAF22]|uniref:tripartite tricarboxylate transporter substrate binding protein n=1 Tax=unclassified Cupriavidus TaxID=2640874 RepID=UPI003F922DC7